MSNTIQTRDYSAKQASLFQCTPSALINEIENRTLTPRGLHVHAYAGVNPAATLIIGAGQNEPTSVGTGSSVGQAVVVVEAREAATGDMAALVTFDSDVWTHWAKHVEVAFHRALAVSPPPAPTAAAKLRVQRLADIQAALGLPTRDLAGILRISRQALYQWLDASREIKLQETSRTRFAVIERIAKRWREQSNSTLGAVVNEPLESGSTLLSMLMAPNIDEDSVFAAFGELLTKLHEKPKSRSQKLADAGFKRRPSLRSLPSDE